MSDTPRTDAAVTLTSQHRYDYYFGDPDFGWVTAAFARQLERENAALRVWIEKEGERTDVCTYHILGRKICSYCQCGRKEKGK